MCNSGQEFLSSSENFPNGWSNPYRYDGADLVRYDSETGLYWMSVRAYDPLGRLAAQGIDVHPYVYTDNNPVTNVDPSGQRYVCGTGDCGAPGPVDPGSNDCKADPTLDGCTPPVTMSPTGHGNRSDATILPRGNSRSHTSSSSSCDATCQQNAKSEAQSIAQKFRQAAKDLQGAIDFWMNCPTLDCWLQVVGTIMAFTAGAGAAIGASATAPAGGVGAAPGFIIGAIVGIIASVGYVAVKGYVEDVLTAEQSLLNSDATVFENENYATLTLDGLEKEKTSLENAGQKFLSEHIDNSLISHFDPFLTPSAVALVQTTNGEIDASIGSQEWEVVQSGFRSTDGTGCVLCGFNLGY